jgi:hypothetical protein
MCKGHTEFLQKYDDKVYQEVVFNEDSVVGR